MDNRAQIDAVDRSVGIEERDGERMRVQTLAQTYPSPIDDVWDALTTAERIPRWFLPVSGDLRLGGTYQLEGNAGGTITACDAPNSFTATWEYGGGTTWITARLTEVDAEHTRFELEHVARAADVTDEMWEQMGPSPTGIGWDGALLGLALHFTTREIRPDNSEEWLQTDEGRAFMRLSADRWAEADVAAGADPATASAAADLVYGMYTGAEPAPMPE